MFEELCKHVSSSLPVNGVLIQSDVKNPGESTDPTHKNHPVLVLERDMRTFRAQPGHSVEKSPKVEATVMYVEYTL